MLPVLSGGLDASLTFSPFGKPAPLTHDRFNSLTIADNIVLRGDDTGGSCALDTSIFHEYALRYLDGNLDVCVDAPFSDIVAGTAVPVLSRVNPVPQGGTAPGVTVFGDATNDRNHNSNYVVDFVTFDSYAVPEPSAVPLLLSGLCAPLFQRRRRVF